MTLDEAVAASRAVFPRFPEEALVTWIAPIAVDYGPPNNSQRWSFVLGATIEFWNAVYWSLEDWPFKLESLDSSSLRCLHEMQKAYFAGERNRYSNIENGHQRLESIMEYIRRHRALPRPPILLSQKDGLAVVDGNHRLLAYHAVRQMNVDAIPGQQPTWIVRPAPAPEYTPNK